MEKNQQNNSLRKELRLSDLPLLPQNPEYFIARKFILKKKGGIAIGLTDPDPEIRAIAEELKETFL
jgi:hypothetical protein